jgi:hypothetical protein
MDRCFEEVSCTKCPKGFLQIYRLGAAQMTRVEPWFFFAMGLDPDLGRTLVFHYLLNFGSVEQ